MTLAQWNTVINVNLTGQFLCAREAVREFKRRGVVPEVSCAAGKIICISSVHEVIPWAGHVNYAASKGGVMLLMKSMAQEVAPYRIRVNSIAPGAIRTPINTAAWSTPEAYNALMTLVPYNRIGEAEDIGQAAVWLASDAADYVTGISLYIDGGMTLYPGFATGGLRSRQNTSTRKATITIWWGDHCGEQQIVILGGGFGGVYTAMHLEKHSVTVSAGRCRHHAGGSRQFFPVLAALPCARERGRVLVNAYMEVPEWPGVWALGDCALIPDRKTGTYYPPTAQHALRQGKRLARNITAVLRGNPQKPFVFATLGQLAAIGKRTGVANILGINFSGFIAWWLWRTIYLSKLPRLEKKLRVVLDWTLDLLFAKDLVQFITLRAPAVSHADHGDHMTNHV